MAARKIKILYLIDYFHRTGGTETHLAHLVTQLDQERFDCEVAVFDLGTNPLIATMRAAGIPVHHFPVAREYTPNAMRQGLLLADLMRKRRFDIVQTFHQKSDTYGAVIARLAGVKHIVSSKRDTGHLRKTRHFFLNRRLKFLFEKIIVVADAVGAAVVQSDRHDPARLVRIYNGVDTSRFKPPSEEARAEAKAYFGFGPDDLVVGMVAGFRREKNHDVFFDGATLAMKAVPRLKLLAVGDGPLLAHFRKIHDHPGSPVRFAGDMQDVTGALKAMDIGALLPSMNEGFSNAVIEKMATGLPMIVSDVGGNAEAIISGENGYVIPPSDAAAFARAIIDIHRSREAQIAMGQRSRELVEERFSLDKMRDEHEALYLGLCR